MSGRTRPTEYAKIAEQPAEKKKGFVEFINKIKPVNEEKDHWVNVLHFCFVSMLQFRDFPLLCPFHDRQTFSQTPESKKN